VLKRNVFKCRLKPDSQSHSKTFAGSLFCFILFLLFTISSQFIKQSYMYACMCVCMCVCMYVLTGICRWFKQRTRPMVSRWFRLCVARPRQGSCWRLVSGAFCDVQCPIYTEVFSAQQTCYSMLWSVLLLHGTTTDVTW